MRRPKLLDAYSCQGGAGMGYHLAGFDVVGVDLEPQPRYPFEFHQGDALAFIRDHGHEFDAIHASPPCHDHSALKTRTGKDHGTGWLLDATIEALAALDKPHVVENVEGADMVTNVVLCGSMFGLGAHARDGRRRILKRHRRFLTTAYVLTPPDQCAGHPVGGVYGNSGGTSGRGYKFTTPEAAEAMGIDWMTGKGLSQAIPPAYTEFLGGGLLDQLRAAA